MKTLLFFAFNIIALNRVNCDYKLGYELIYQYDFQGNPPNYIDYKNYPIAYDAYYKYEITQLTKPPHIITTRHTFNPFRVFKDNRGYRLNVVNGVLYLMNDTISYKIDTQNHGNVFQTNADFKSGLFFFLCKFSAERFGKLLMLDYLDNSVDPSKGLKPVYLSAFGDKISAIGVQEKTGNLALSVKKDDFKWSLELYKKIVENDDMETEIETAESNNIATANRNKTADKGPKSEKIQESKGLTDKETAQREIEKVFKDIMDTIPNSYVWWLNKKDQFSASVQEIIKRLKVLDNSKPNEKQKSKRLERRLNICKHKYDLLIRATTYRDKNDYQIDVRSVFPAPKQVIKLYASNDDVIKSDDENLYYCGLKKDLRNLMKNNLDIDYEEE